MRDKAYEEHHAYAEDDGAYISTHELYVQLHQQLRQRML